MTAQLTFDVSGDPVYPADVAEIFDKIGRKFEDADLRGPGSNGWLREEAEAYVRNYSGDFEYLVSMSEALTKYNGLTLSQARGVLNCMRADYLRRAQSFDFSAHATTVTVQPVVANGKYTIVHTEGNHTTLHVETVDDNEHAKMAAKGFDVPKGTQRVSYLSGSDNQTDYTGCAFLFGSRVQMFKRFKNAGNLRRACEYIATATLEQRHILGIAYAVMSGECYICGRELTDEKSIAAGIGPICARNIGLVR